MKTFKRIICPVDVYDFQWESAEYALSIATAFDAKISVVYVMEPVPLRYIGEVSLPSFDEEKRLKQQAEAKMAEIMTHFCRICQDQGEVVIGDAADKILQIAEEHAGDLIVMASHCRTLVCRAIHGSVTNKVLANTKIPVLVVYPKKE